MQHAIMLLVRTAQGKDSFNIIKIFHYSPMFYILEKVIHSTLHSQQQATFSMTGNMGFRPKHSIIVSMTELTVNVFLLWREKNTVRQYMWISPGMQGLWHHTPQYIIAYVYVLVCQMWSLRLVKELSKNMKQAVYELLWYTIHESWTSNMVND